MGRRRGFDEAEVLGRCRELFLRNGFEGTSIDDLVTATGVQRGSLYGAFGSKRGLFVATLTGLNTDRLDHLDLLLVALMEMAARDPEVRDICAATLRPTSHTAALLGHRLLERAGLAPATTSTPRSERTSS